MRQIQISIKVEMFDKDKLEKINIYADANSPWEAICAAFYELTSAFIAKGRELPSFGVREI